ncbi:MAG TPA: glutamate-cysteine ligase family protein [Gemmatimonadales bacterium]|nr:glutamate-cysteine ligase family protein [Gemmatimonadales bacterium]
MSRLARADLAAHLAERVFAPAPAASSATAPSARGHVGVEAELLATEASTGRPCPLERNTDGEVALLPFLRRFGAAQGWVEQRTSKGAPCFHVPGGGVLCFEPGGQLEYATPPRNSASLLIDAIRAVVQPLVAAADGEGIALIAVGIDPLNPVEGVPLQVQADRYTRMAEHFGRIGPAGARMMRQTAAFQVNLDFGAVPRARWHLLNALAPWVTAMFANSRMYEGTDSGHCSYRAHCWRTLDPRRTGLPFDQRQPVERYLEFALGAPAILLSAVRGEYHSFRHWLRTANPSLHDWEAHLTTLFPDVRPRGHLEVRACDAVDAAWYPAPLAFLTGLCYEPRALHAALELLPAPSSELLERAGKFGMAEPTIAGLAGDLVDIALMGCAALGPDFFDPAHLEEARTFFDRYTRRGRSPADDLSDAAVAA